MKYEKGSFITIPNKGHLAKLEPYIQSVYLWICSYADDDGLCFPSRTTLAKMAGCSVKSVDRALELLVEKKLLSKTTRKDREKNLTNLYQIEILAWGGVSQSLGGVSQSLGVASEGRTELYPVLTETTEGAGYREDSDELEREEKISSRVIPSPYSIELTQQAWEDGELRLQVLNWYFNAADLWPRATNRFKLKAMMARHSNAAARIARAEWTPKELSQAKKKIDQNEKLQGEWTLETIEKYLTK